MVEEFEEFEEEFEENEILKQLTLRIPEQYDRELRELGARMEIPTNRQGAINYILFLYFDKKYSEENQTKFI